MSVSDGDEDRKGSSAGNGGLDNFEGSSRALAGGGQDRLTLGAFLRVEREKRGITPEQLASATKINLRRIHALEGDLYTELPAAPFVRGFIESYCRFIGLNSREVLLRFDFFLRDQFARRTEGGEGVSGYAFDRRENEQSRTLLWVVTGVFAVAGVIGIAVLRPSSRHHAGENIEALKKESGTTASESEPKGSEELPSPAPSASGSPEASAQPSGQPSEAPVTVLPSASPSPSPSASPKPSASPSPKASAKPSASPSPAPSPVTAPSPAAVVSPVASAAPIPTEWVPGSVGPDAEDPLSSGVKLPREQIAHKIVARALADVWVRYQCDDRAPMKFILRAGKILVLRGAGKISLQTSNPDALELSYNSTSYRPLSKARPPTAQSSGATWTFGGAASEAFPGQKPMSKTPGPVPSAAPSPVASNSP